MVTILAKENSSRSTTENIAVRGGVDYPGAPRYAYNAPYITDKKPDTIAI